MQRPERLYYNEFSTPHQPLTLTIDMEKELAPIDGRLTAIEDKVAVLASLRADDKIAYSAKEAALAIGASRSAIYEYVQNGELPAKRLGKTRIIIRRDDLIAFVDALPSANGWTADNEYDDNG